MGYDKFFTWIEDIAENTVESSFDYELIKYVCF